MPYPWHTGILSSESVLQIHRRHFQLDFLKPKGVMDYRVQRHGRDSRFLSSCGNLISGCDELIYKVLYYTHGYVGHNVTLIRYMQLLD